MQHNSVTFRVFVGASCAQGIATVTYRQPGSAAQAVQKINGLDLAGQKIQVGDWIHRARGSVRAFVVVLAWCSVWEEVYFYGG